MFPLRQTKVRNDCFVFFLSNLKTHSLVTADLVVSCVGLICCADLEDIMAGHIKLRRTSKKNVLAFTQPIFPASLRADLEAKDDTKEYKKKLAFVARHFQHRDKDTGKLDGTWWCEKAWKKYKATLSSWKDIMNEDNSPYEVPKKTTLFVFPKKLYNFEDTEYTKNLFRKDGSIIWTTMNMQTAHQLVGTIRFMVPTANAKVDLSKVAGAVGELVAQVGKMAIAKDAEEGMMI